jgi:hypothetical protein
MNTDQQVVTQLQKPIETQNNAQQVPDPLNWANTVQALNQLASEIKPVSADPAEAKLDETTILDNNGNRIELNEDLKKPDVIKK